MSADAERWATLRDREALGDLLSVAELDELLAIEVRDPESRIFVTQMRELEAYLDGKLGERPNASDREVADRALSAVQLTSPSARRAVDSDAELERVVDPDGPGWIRVLALALSVGMPIAAVVALVFHEPTVPSPHARLSVQGQPSPSPGAPRLRPKVEALASVHTAQRGGRLRRSGRLLPSNTMLSQGDELSAGEKPGCFVIEPALEVCVGVNSTVQLANLSLGALAIDLSVGRAAATLGEQPHAGGFSINAGEVRASALGTIFGLERNEDASLVRVRALRGRVLVQAGSQRQEIENAHAAVFRSQEHTLEVVEIPPPQAQREWELVAAGLPSSGMPAQTPASLAPARVFVRAPTAPVAGSGASAATSASVTPAAPTLPAGTTLVSAPLEASAAPPGAPGMPGAPNPPPTTKTARDLMQDAWELLKSEQWGAAALVYETIARQYPQSEEAHVVLVRLGDLRLERLKQPELALQAFDQYLQGGGGPLEAEARYGRISAFRRLAQPEEERAAIEEFLRLHPKSPKLGVLTARQRALTGP